MSGVNKVILIGNLGKDPEVRMTNSGTAVCEMGIACTTSRRTQDGQWEDQTEWVTVVTFGRTAENAGKYLAKGRSVYVEGRLQTRSWDDQDGKKRYKTEVVANTLQFLGGRGQDDSYSSKTPASSSGGQQGGGYGGGQQGGGQQGGGQQGGGQQGGGYGGGQQGGGQQSDPPQQDGQSGSLPSFGGGASNPPAPAPSGGDPGFHDDDIPF
jgi:single-strand DNA-binding protein